MLSLDRPICGDRTLAIRRTNGDFWGLEVDARYFYLVADTVRDLIVWKFLIPSHVSREEVVSAFNTQPIKTWLSDNDIDYVEHDWM